MYLMCIDFHIETAIWGTNLFFTLTFRPSQFEDIYPTEDVESQTCCRCTSFSGQTVGESWDPIFGWSSISGVLDSLDLSERWHGADMVKKNRCWRNDSPIKNPDRGVFVTLVGWNHVCWIWIVSKFGSFVDVAAVAMLTRTHRHTHAHTLEIGYVVEVLLIDLVLALKIPELLHPYWAKFRMLGLWLSPLAIDHRKILDI